MSNGLNIRQDGALDLVSLGALVHRLDPGVIPFRKATECQIHVSGGEFNVAANLADCFGMRTGVATAMVDYPIGDLVAERVRAMGVRPFYKHFAHDGVSGPNLATVYSDRGYGVRAPVVFYNRCNEAAARLKPGDLNFREKLWRISGGLGRAQDVVRRIMAYVDVLVGNEEDLQKGLGIPGPEVAATSKLDTSAFVAMIDSVVKQQSNVKA